MGRMYLTIFNLFTDENYYLCVFLGIFIFFTFISFLFSYKNKSANIFALITLCGLFYYILDLFQFFGIFTEIDSDLKPLINTILLFLVIQFLVEINYAEKIIYKKIIIFNCTLLGLILLLYLIFFQNDLIFNLLVKIFNFSYFYPLMIIIIINFSLNLYKIKKNGGKFFELKASFIVLMGFIFSFIGGIIYPINKFLTLFFQLLSTCLVTGGYFKLGSSAPFLQNLKPNSIKKRIESSHIQLQNFSDILPEIYFEMDSMGNIKFFNEKFSTTFNYSEDELKKLTIFNLIDPNKIHQFEIDIQKRIKKELIGGVEYFFRKKDGTKIPVLMYAKPFFKGKKPKYLICILVDLSEMEAVERQLLKDEEILRYITENSMNLYFIHNLQGEFTYLSPQIKNILGYEPEEILSEKTKFTDLLSDNPLNYRAIESTQNAILDKRTQVSYDVEVFNKQRDKIWLTITKSPLFINNNFVGMVGSASDITERKKMDMKLIESEKKYRTLFHSINDAVFIHDMNGKFLEVNEIAIKRYDYSLEEYLKMSIKELDSPKFYALFKNRINELLIKGETILESEHITKFGKRIPVEVNARIITYESKPAVLSIARDISERKEHEMKMILYEKQQIQSQRLESIAILAAGIAHEFNNKLTILQGNIDYLEICPENEKKEVFEELRTEGLNAKNLIQQLITFSEGGAPIKESRDINQIVESSAKFILSGSKSQCRFKFEGSNTAKVDLDQLNQVLNNIITNADQSMKNGGLIDIYVKTIEIHEDDLLNLVPGRYVKISIKDQGEGIKPEYYDKIFNLYFTTKENGTGLGLPIAYSIIKRHGGLITFESEENIGTTFHIFLPS